jgi:hypothetical protein
MKKYRANAASLERVIYGVGLVAGLRGFNETRPLAEPFEALNNELHNAYTSRVARYLPLVKARASLRIAEFQTDMAIRTFARAVEIADGGRKGPLYNHVFPHGLKTVVAPSGRRQLEPTRGLIEHVTKSRHEGIDPVRTEWLPKLETAAAALQDAIGVHGTAQSAYLDAFRSELALREEHEMAVDRLIGKVRAAFPKDHAWQDIVFPPPRRPRSAASDDELDDGDDDLEDPDPSLAADAPPA